MPRPYPLHLDPHIHAAALLAMRFIAACRKAEPVIMLDAQAITDICWCAVRIQSGRPDEEMVRRVVAVITEGC